MITPALLVDAVAKEVEEAVKNYKMKAEGQADKHVTVYRQHISDEDFNDDSYYPLVIVSYENSQDTDEGSTAVIGLTVGTHGFEKDSWLDMLSVLERIRQRLLMFRTLSHRFRLVLPTKFETIEVQPYPFWFGYGTLTYTIAQPNEQMQDGWLKIMEEDNA